MTIEQIEAGICRIESIIKDIHDGFAGIDQGHSEILKVTSGMREIIRQESPMYLDSKGQWQLRV